MFCVWIIAFVVVSLFGLQSGSISHMNNNKFNTIAPVLATQLLTKITQDLENWSQTNGDFGEKYPGMTWTCELVDADFDDLEYISLENMSRLKKIKLQIIDSSESSTFEVVSWRLANE